MHVSKKKIFYYHLFSQCRPKRIWEIRPLCGKYPNSPYYLFMFIFSFSLSINSPTHPNFVVGGWCPTPTPMVIRSSQTSKGLYPLSLPLFFFFFFFSLFFFFFNLGGGGPRPVCHPPWVRQCSRLSGVKGIVTNSFGRILYCMVLRLS